MLPRKNPVKKAATGIRGGSTSGAGIKRANATSQPSTAKKQKFEFPKQGVVGSSSGPSSSSSANAAFTRIVELDTSWQDTIKDMTITAKEFKPMLKANKEKGKTAKAICVPIKLLLKNEDGSSIDFELLKEILQAIPNEPEALKSTHVFGAIFELLNKFEAHCQVMNLSILPVALQLVRSIDVWPPTLLNYVLYDSMGARTWVDKPEATVILLAAFSLFGEVLIPSDGMFQAITDQISFIKDVAREPPKYQLSDDQKNTLLKSTIDYTEKAADNGSSKPLIRTLCMLCANDHFRLMAAHKLDVWLMNNKYQRYAMELILFVASNTRNINSKVDLEILSLMSKIRLQKSRQVQNVFQSAIKEIVTNCPESLPVLTEFIVENDLTSSSKAQNNIGFLQFLFTQNQTEVLKLVARRLISRLERPEQLKLVRLFVKEFYRSLTGSPFQFSLAIIDALKNHNGNNVTLVFQHCLDIICMLPFLAISNTVRDAAQVRRTSGNLSNAQVNVLERFQQQFQTFLFETVTAIKGIVSHLQLNPANLMDAINALLYLRPYTYYSTDSWPTEADFNTSIRLISECQIDEKIVQMLIEMDSETVMPIDVLKLLRNLTSRTLNIGTDLDMNKGLCVKNADIIAKLFNLCLINRKNPQLKLAETNLYWRCWEIIFCWSCMNSKLLKNIYSMYPTLRMLFTMTISGEFNFHSIRFDDCTAEQIRNNDAEERAKEVAEIKKLDQQDMEFEFSPSNVCLLNPTGPARQPPAEFITRLKHLNDQCSFSVNLCQISDPNILARVCADLGPHRVLPTVISYLTNKPDQLESVPLICVCQLFLVVICQQNGMPIDNLVHLSHSSSLSRLTVNTELQELVHKFIKNHVKDETKPVESSRVVVEFLVRKLSASVADERDAACIGLEKLLGSDSSTSVEFDPSLLTNVAHFAEFKEDLCSLLATACTIEKRLNLVTKYLGFIVEHIDENSTTRIAPRLSAIVERSNSSSAEHKTIRQNLIRFFADFMRKLVEGGKQKSGTGSQLTSPVNVQDKLVIQLTYPKAVQIEVDSYIVKAIMELLCESFGDYETQSSDNKSREYLMNIWFPSKKLIVTSANDPSTSIEILPEELKLKMLSAKDERIVRVALSDATPKKALKYIQTFALSSFSCEHLLRILNNSKIDPSEASAAVPFVRAYGNFVGAEEFLKKFENKNVEVKMEVDQSRPALFVPIEPPVLSPETSFVNDDDDEEMTDAVAKFNDTASIRSYLQKILNEPTIKDTSFTFTSDWIQFLNAVKKNVEMAKVALKFAHEHLLQMNRQMAPVLYSLLKCVTNHSEDATFQKFLSGFTDHIKLVLPSNTAILAILKPYSIANLKPIIAKQTKDVEMPTASNKENKKEKDSMECKDLKMHWAISEYFEAIQIQNNENAKELAKVLKQELDDYIRNEPLVFSRQLPLLFNHVQNLLKLNTRQAIQIDSYAALLFVIDLVSRNGWNAFKNTQAFETLLEIFLNSMAAHSKKSRQWESVLDRLTKLMQSYLNFNPVLAVKFVERNKDAFFNLSTLYPNLRSLNDFLHDSIPRIF